MDLARKPHFDNFEKDEKLFRSHLDISNKADWQCVSEDTEILSLDGWKKMGDLKKGDGVFSFDTKTNHIKDDVVIVVHEYKLNNETVISICNDKTDQLITSNHRVLAKKCRKKKKLAGKGRKRAWEEKYRYIKAFDLIPLTSLKGAIEYRIPVSGLYDGDLSVGDDVAELIGWFLSDGCIPPRKSNRSYITQSKPDTLKELRKLLNRLSKAGLHYREWSRKKGKRKNGDDYFDEHRFYISNNDQIMKGIIDLIPGRLPSNRLFRLKLSEKNRLLRGIFLGDGSKNVFTNQYNAVHETRKEFQDWFQTMAHLSGYRCRLGNNGEYSNISKRQTVDIYGKRHIKELKYTGKVWSITTTRSNYIAKRNGKVFITGNSKYFIPRTYGLVMSSLSEFAINKPDIVVEPDGKTDAIRSPYLKAVMMANWRKNKGNAELLFALLDVLKLGIAIIDVGYKKQERSIKDIISYDPLTESMEWENKKIYDFDDVYFETVNPRYFWVDESANSVINANDCIRKYVYNEQVFHDIFDTKFKNAKKVISAGVAQKDEFFKPFVGDGTNTNEVCVFKYNNKSKDATWWIANGVFLNNPNDPIPYHHKQLHYVDIKIAPYDKYTFYGLSLPRIVADIQHELNTHRNMATDQTHLNIFSPFFYSADEDIDESMFTLEPGVGIPVSDPNSFKFFTQGQVGQDAYKMMDMLDEDSRQATGFDLRQQGLATGGTATETAILKETSLKRINLYLRFLEDYSMPDFGGLWGDTIQQFYFQSTEKKTKKVKDRNKGTEREEIFRSVKVPKSDISSFRSVSSEGGYNFLDVTPDDIRGKFDFNVRIGTTIAVSKELSKQVKLQLYSILSTDNLVKRDKLVADLLVANDLDPEEYMARGAEININDSLALAEEQNKQIIAGRKPQVIPDLITPEHIQIHDALIKSGNVGNDIIKAIRQHTIDEIRIAKGGFPTASVPASGMTGNFPAIERNPGMSGPLAKQPGLTKESLQPSTAAEITSKTSPAVIGPAINKPIIRQ